MALNGLLCADVPLRNYTHYHYHFDVDIVFNVEYRIFIENVYKFEGCSA